MFTPKETMAMEREMLLLLRYNVEVNTKEILEAGKPFLSMISDEKPLPMLPTKTITVSSGEKEEESPIYSLVEPLNFMDISPLPSTTPCLSPQRNSSPDSSNSPESDTEIGNVQFAALVQVPTPPPIVAVRLSHGNSTNDQPLVRAGDVPFNPSFITVRNRPVKKTVEEGGSGVVRPAKMYHLPSSE